MGSYKARGGNDINANGDLANDELGLQVQLRSTGTTWKSQLQVGSQTHESTTVLSSYGKYQLILDRTLNTASLWYKNMTAGTDWAVLTGLSEVATGFTNNSSLHDPSTWNGFGVHGEGRTSVFDNLSFRKADVSTRTLAFPVTNEGSESRLTVDVTGQYLTQGLTATATGDFTFDNGTQSTIVTAGSSLGVRFSPTASGDRTGTVSLSSTEMLRPLTVALSGRAAPRVISFSSTTPDGTYTAGDSINLTAMTSETVTAGSTMRVTLDTGATVTLTAASQGTTLSGTYVVTAGQATSDLSIASYDASSTTDIAGNSISTTSLPTGTNSLAGSHNIVVAAPSATPSTQPSTSTTTTTAVVRVATDTSPQTTTSLPMTTTASQVAPGISTRRAATSPAVESREDSTTTTVAPTLTVMPELPSATPGQLVAMIDGRRVNGTAAVDGSTVMIEVADIEVSVRCERRDGTPITPTKDGELRFEPGAQMTVTVSGFLGNSEIAIEMRSIPTALGALQSDSDGAATGVFIVPDSVEIGNHRLVVEGSDQAGQAVTVGLGVLMVPVDTQGLSGVVIAIVLIAGVAAVLVPAEAARRRRRRT